MKNNNSTIRCALAIALTLALSANIAHAGGAGGKGGGSNGGAGGVAGQDGGTGTGIGNGGGGGGGNNGLIAPGAGGKGGGGGDGGSTSASDGGAGKAIGGGGGGGNYGAYYSTTTTTPKNITGGAGGAGGAGGDGDGGGGGGGGGGGDGVVFTADSGTLTSNTRAVITGGNGGDANGGGGGGGDGIVSTSTGSLTNDTGSIKGGDGGYSGQGGMTGPLGGSGVVLGSGVLTNTNGTITGGVGGRAFSGTGGVGGAGVVGSATGTVINNTNNSSIAGGVGGYAENSLGANSGGAGGAGITFTAAGTLTNANTATIAGGAGGTAASASSGAGGAGVVGTAGSVAIINAGNISGTGGSNAITFFGSDNSLELQSGYSFVGNVINDSAGNNNTLIFGGDTDSNFVLSQIGNTAQYQHFTALSKTGTSTWTLTGSMINATTEPTTIANGALNIFADDQLGTAGVSLTLGDATANTAGTLQFGAGGVDVTRPISLVGTEGGVIDTAAYDNTLSGVISDADVNVPSPLTKYGSGTLTLTGANTYSGGTTITEGTLQIGDGTTDGNITGNITNDATLVFNQTQVNASYAGEISGSGSLTKKGTGTLRLNRENTYSGGTKIANGALVISADFNLGNSNATLTLGDATANTAGTLQFGAGGVDVARPISLAGTAGGVIDTNGFDNTLSGVIAGPGSLTKNGSGTLTLTKNNTYTGGTSIAEGTLQPGVDNAIGGLVTSGIASDNSLDLKGFSIALTGLEGGSSTNGTVINSDATTAATLTVGNDNTDHTYGGTISGAVALTKTGTNTQSLTGVNDYAGGTTVAEGTLQLGVDNAIGGLVTSGVTSDNSLDLSGFSIALTGLEGGADHGTVTNSDATTTVTLTVGDTKGNDHNYDGTISGAVALTKTGANTQSLTGVNTYSGDTTVEAGTLKLSKLFSTNGDFTTKSDATTILDAGATLSVGAFKQDNASNLEITLGSTSNIAATYAATLGGSLKVNGFDTTATAIPVTASNLGKALYTVIQSTNDITGDFTNVSNINSAVDYIVFKGGVSANKKQYNLGLALAWDQGVTGDFTIDSSDTFTVDTPLKDVVNPAVGWDGKSLTKKGTGTLTLTRNNTYTGGTTIAAGTLTLYGAQLTGNVIGQAGSKFELQNGAILTGTVDPTNMTLDATSKWNMTGDSTVATLTNDGSIVATDLTANSTLTIANYNGTGTISLNASLGNTVTADELIITTQNSDINLTIKNLSGTLNKPLTIADNVIVAITPNPKMVTLSPFNVGNFKYSLKQGTGVNANNLYLVSVALAPVAIPSLTNFMLLLASLVLIIAIPLSNKRFIKRFTA